MVNDSDSADFVCENIVVQEVLDADNAPLKARNGQYMSRDIVQFVPLQQFKKQREGQFSLVLNGSIRIYDVSCMMLLYPVGSRSSG